MPTSITQSDYNNALITSYDAYKEHMINDLVGNLTYKGDSTNGNKSFKASIYQNPTNNKYIIAFRGTDLGNVNDLQADFLNRRFKKC